jgi:male-specific lethal 1
MSPQKRSRPSKSADSENSNSSQAVLLNTSIINGTKLDIKELRKAAARTKRRAASIVSGAKSIFEEDEVEEIVPPLTQCAIPKEIFTTDQEYDLVSAWDKRTFELPAQGDLLTNDCDFSTNSMADKIEVPLFRVNVFPPIYITEGTENLDDETFNRRHQKLEIDERRRKRWDMQRLREQKHNEKLKQGRYYSQNAFVGGPEKQSLAKKKLPEIESFFPDAKDAHYIEVSEKLPVVAFGNPIPRLAEKPFSLPWSVSVDTSKTPQAVSTTSSSSSCPSVSKNRVVKKAKET